MSPRASTESSDRRAGVKAATGTFVLLCLFIGLFSPLPYLLVGLEEGGPGLADHYFDKSGFVRASLMVHAASAGIALMLTPVQASQRIRRSRPAAHRVSGRISAVTITVAGISGLVIAPVGYAGLVGFLGFGTLSVLWIYCMVRSVTDARARRFSSHRDWSLRVMALTFAAVTLRLLLISYTAGAVALSGADPDDAFDQIYPFLPFLCWVPNLLVMEWYLRTRSRPAVRPVVA